MSDLIVDAHDVVESESHPASKAKVMVSSAWRGGAPKFAEKKKRAGGRGEEEGISGSGRRKYVKLGL
jgi:hypothetical protein